MSTTDASGLQEKVQKTEQTLVWFIQDVVRGTWFRRLVFLLVVFAILASPSVITWCASLFAEQLPSWYGAIYWFVIGLLLLVTLVVGMRTIPRRSIVRAPVDPGAVRGLLPFNAEDSEIFTRLEREVELHRVLSSLLDPSFRFGILIGPSGAGKTSFLRAGLLAKLRESKIPAVYVELSNEDPLTSINREVIRQGHGTLSGVLMVDQFEQFFLHQSMDHRRTLIETLKRWYQRDSGVRILISIRAEDAWQMLEIQESLEYQLSNQNYIKLAKFSVEQAVNVLGVLCEKASIVFDSDFVHKVVDHELRDPDDGLVSPVNLGIIILVLATRRQAFTPESFKAYGGIDGLLEAWLDSQLEAAKYQGLEKAAIRTLTVLSDLERNRRAGILTIDAIAARLADDLTRTAVERAVGWLAAPDVRLAIRVEKPESVGYQLGHERLIPAIRKVAGKLLDDVARANDLLDRRVRTWVDNNRSPRYLLSLFEYWRVERQRPYLSWGEARADKEALLKRSRSRLRHRATIAASGLFFLLAGYTAWCSNTVQRYYIKTELAGLAKSSPSVDAAHALAAVGDWTSARHLADRYLGGGDAHEDALAQIAIEMARVGLARNDRSLLAGAPELAATAGDSGLDALREIAIEMTKAGLIRKDEALVEQACRVAERLNWGDTRPRTIREIASEMVKAGLFNKAKELLEQALSEAEEHNYSSSRAAPEILIEMVKLGLASKDQNLVVHAISHAEKLDSNQSVQALLGIVGQMANAGDTAKATELLEQALKEIQDLSPRDRSNARRDIAQEMAKIGNATGARELLEELAVDKGPGALAPRDIVLEMAKAGLVSKDQTLVDEARKMAGTLIPGDSSYVLRMIALESGKAAQANGDKNGAEQAVQEALKIDRVDSSMELWQIAMWVGDANSAKKLLERASVELNDFHGHSGTGFGLLQIPVEMGKLAVVKKDQKLLERALRAVDSELLRQWRPRALREIAVEAAKAGETTKARQLLEQAWQEAGNVRSDEYYVVLNWIAGDMAALGHLKRAREIAESNRGATRSEVLATILLADSEARRSATR